MKELTEKESMEVNGGSLFLALAAGLAGKLAYDILFNAPESAENFNNGYQKGINTFN
jgi:hypothetical protein